MADKISYGARGMLVVPIIGTTGDVPKYGVPLTWGGLKKVTHKTSSETETIFADDVAWDVNVSESGGELSVTHLAIPLEVKQIAFGVALDAKKARVYGAKTKSPVGIVWQTREKNDKGEIDDTLHVVFKATFEEPEISSETKEDKTKQQEFESKATTSTVAFPGFANPISYIELRRSEVGNTVYDNALKEMFIPTAV